MDSCELFLKFSPLPWQHWQHYTVQCTMYNVLCIVRKNNLNFRIKPTVAFLQLERMLRYMSGFWAHTSTSTLYSRKPPDVKTMMYRPTTCNCLPHGDIQ